MTKNQLPYAGMRCGNNGQFVYAVDLDKAIAEVERLRAELAIVTKDRDTLLEMSGHTLEQVARRIEKLRRGVHELTPVIYHGGETFESLVEKRLKEAREIYGPSAKNVTYLSRVAAQHVRDFIQRLADLLEAQRAQTRAGMRNDAPDEGPSPEPESSDRHSGRATIWVCNPCGGEHATRVPACALCGSANLRSAEGAPCSVDEPDGDVPDSFYSLSIGFDEKGQPQICEGYDDSFWCPGNTGKFTREELRKLANVNIAQWEQFKRWLAENSKAPL